MDRPLTGEPLGVDLLNTRWLDHGQPADLLSTVTGVRNWLHERGLSSGRASERTRQALIHTRTVLGEVVNGVAGAEERFNAVLARGLVVHALEHGQAHERVLLTDREWGPAWLAATDYLRLADADPAAIRRCAQSGCILYFHDPSGRRRWCTMTGCGNRAKANRHYARHNPTANPPPDRLPIDRGVAPQP